MTPHQLATWLLLFGETDAAVGEQLLAGAAAAAMQAAGTLANAPAPAPAQPPMVGEKPVPQPEAPGQTVLSTLGLELAQLSHTAVMEFFELDATTVGGSVIRLHNGVSEQLGNVVWQGVAYTRFPVEFKGAQRSGDGPMPRATLRLGNVAGLLGTLIRTYRGLEGVKVTRRRTLAKYLDAVNFVGGVNATADPAARYADEIYFVDHIPGRDSQVVEFELASPLDVQGVMLPARQILHGVCIWGYRSADCGYAGPPVARADDTPTAVLAEDACGHSIKSCRLRKWSDNELGYGGFPGAGVIRSA